MADPAPHCCLIQPHPPGSHRGEGGIVQPCHRALALLQPAGTLPSPSTHVLYLSRSCPTAPAGLGGAASTPRPVQASPPPPASFPGPGRAKISYGSR